MLECMPLNARTAGRASRRFLTLHQYKNAYRTAGCAPQCLTTRLNERSHRTAGYASLLTSWEKPERPTSYLIDATSAVTETRYHSLWTMGNDFAASAMEIASNHAKIAAGGNLSDNRDWHYVHVNGPGSLIEVRPVLRGFGCCACILRRSSAGTGNVWSCVQQGR